LELQTVKSEPEAEAMSTVEEKVELLYQGQRLTRDEFLRRWEALPHLKNAELIGGRVFMPSPVSAGHGTTDNRLATWIGVYAAYTPVCEPAGNATWLMLEDAPQPDDSLRKLTEFGGHSHLEGKLFAGAPELAGEVSLSSKDHDLHEKLELYQAAQVDEYLVVLVESKQILWHRLVKGVYERLLPSADGILRSQVFPGLWLDPAAMLTNNMAKVLATLLEGLQSPEHAAFVKKGQCHAND
jgi:Uma2 family endonuclease